MPLEKVLTEYNAKSIKVMSSEDSSALFPWVLIEQLAKKYHVPVKCVKKGFEASFLMGIGPDYYIDKYLKGIEIEKLEGFEDVYISLTRNKSGST